MSKKRETRFVQARELRVKRNEAGQASMEGYAAVFNSLSQDLGGFKEQILPGAFTATLADGADVRALFNHDESMVLGRTKSGTLELSEDKTGLLWRCQLPDTQVARDLAVSIDRGDIDQCSFGFFCLDDEWDLMDDGTCVRSVKKAELFDVSAVTYPAYTDTSVAMRAMWKDGQPESIASAIRSLRNPADQAAADELRCLRARMRLIAADL